MGVGVLSRRLGSWWLDGWNLVEWCINRRLDGKVEIGVVGELEQVVGSGVEVIRYEVGRKGWLYGGGRQLRPEWLRCSEEEVEGIRRKHGSISEDGFWVVGRSRGDSESMRVPYKAGTVMDAEFEGWWRGFDEGGLVRKRGKVEWGIGDIFFTEERVRSGRELLRRLYLCGERAGIRHAMFPGYGTALGIVRHGGFVPNDRDMDMVIVSDWITPEQGNLYVEECRKDGLGEYRWREPERRKDNGMPLWFSLGPENPLENGVKCCQWFWFEHGGYWWHTKGGEWVNPMKFSHKNVQYQSTDAAVCKGVPLECLVSLVDYDFGGVQINMPTTVGKCLDAWYPCWMVPEEGASAHLNVMVVKDWNDKDTWTVN